MGAIFRALSLPPGGLSRFLPGGIGANHGRLRHVGWEKCCHGLTSRPRETSSVLFLDELLFLLCIQLHLVLVCLQGLCLLGISLRVSLVGFLLGARLGMAMLLVFLPPRELVRGGPSALSAALGGASVCLARVSGGGVKRVRLYRKTPAHLARLGISRVQVCPRVWKRLRDPQGPDSSFPGSKFLRVHQEAGGHGPGFARAGIG